MIYKQQGDVLLIASKIPSSAKKIKTRPLAYGEVSNHSHVIDGYALMYEDDSGVTYFKNDTEVTIKHEEHKPITLPPGEWEIGIVKEFDPFDMETRQVRD